MVRFFFTLDDLARTRFALSPAWELARSLLALREPSTAALHLPWLRGLSGRLGGLDLEAAVALVPGRGYMPDFLTPPPAGPLGDVHEDLARLRRTPPDQVRAEMELFATQNRAPRVAKPWLADPTRELDRLADTLTGFWERAVAPVWPRVRAFLEADLTHRARELARGGPAALFADLHPHVAWAGDHLEVRNDRYSEDVRLEGRGLVLVPSAFAWERPATITRAPWHPALIYPARGIETLWADADAAPEGLARLLGGTRAAILADLGAPRSTSELAARLALLPSGVSQHLSVLHGAGLVTRHRDGRAVLYVRTARGDALVQA